MSRRLGLFLTGLLRLVVSYDAMCGLRPPVDDVDPISEFGLAYDCHDLPLADVQPGCPKYCWYEIPLCYMNLVEPCAVCYSEGPPPNSRLTVTQAKSKTQVETHPVWCHMVAPAALKFVPPCNGVRGAAETNTTGCAKWCQWLPELLWQEPVECQACMGQLHRVTNATAHAHASTMDLFP
mmetsp:Transcript_28366/g.65819  ORF Transcript_28366/g.65819 Transcript_28366/m.65819 type:complete len:180 (+) Transcript_28366:184-723(+)